MWKRETSTAFELFVTTLCEGSSRREKTRVLIFENRAFLSIMEQQKKKRKDGDNLFLSKYSHSQNADWCLSFKVNT